MLLYCQLAKYLQVNELPPTLSLCNHQRLIELIPEKYQGHYDDQNHTIRISDELKSELNIEQSEEETQIPNNILIEAFDITLQNFEMISYYTLDKKLAIQFQSYYPLAKALDTYLAGNEIIENTKKGKLKYHLARYELYFNLNLPESRNQLIKLKSIIDINIDEQGDILDLLLVAQYHQLNGLNNHFVCYYSDAEKAFQEADKFFKKSSVKAKTSDQRMAITRLRVINRVDLAYLYLSTQLLDEIKKTLDELIQQEEDIVCIAVIPEWHLARMFVTYINDHLNKIDAKQAVSETEEVISNIDNVGGYIFHSKLISMTYQVLLSHGELKEDVKEKYEECIKLLSTILPKDHLEIEKTTANWLYLKWHHDNDIAGIFEQFEKTINKIRLTYEIDSHHEIVKYLIMLGVVCHNDNDFGAAKDKFSKAKSHITNLQKDKFQFLANLNTIDNLLGEMSKDLGNIEIAQTKYELSLLAQLQKCSNEDKQKFIAHARWLKANLIFKDKNHQLTFDDLIKDLDGHKLSASQELQASTGSLTIFDEYSAICINNLGESDLIRLENLPSCEKKFKLVWQSLRHRYANNSANVLLAQNNLIKCQFYSGSIFALLHTPPQSFFKDAFDSYQTVQDKLTLIQVCLTYGKMYLSIMNLRRAKQFIKNGLGFIQKLKKELGKESNIGKKESSLLNALFAEINAYLGDLPKAIECVQRSLKYLNHLELRRSNDQVPTPRILELLTINVRALSIIAIQKASNKDQLLSEIQMKLIQFISPGIETENESIGKTLGCVISYVISNYITHYRSFYLAELIEAYLVFAQLYYRANQTTSAQQALDNASHYFHMSSGILEVAQTKLICEGIASRLALNLQQGPNESVILNILTNPKVETLKSSGWDVLQLADYITGQILQHNQELFASPQQSTEEIIAHVKSVVTSVMSREIVNGESVSIENRLIHLKLKIDWLGSTLTSTLSIVKEAVRKNLLTQPELSHDTFSQMIESLKARGLYGLMSANTLVQRINGFEQKPPCNSVPRYSEILSHFTSILTDSTATNNDKWYVYGVIITLNLVVHDIESAIKLIDQYRQEFDEKIFISLLFLAGYLRIDLDQIVVQLSDAYNNLPQAETRYPYLASLMLHNLGCYTQLQALHKKNFADPGAIASWKKLSSSAKDAFIESIHIRDLSATKCELLNHILQTRDKTQSFESLSQQLEEYQLLEIDHLSDSSMSYGHVERPMLVSPLQFILELHNQSIRVSSKALHLYLLVCLYTGTNKPGNQSSTVDEVAIDEFPITHQLKPESVHQKIYQNALKDQVDQLYTNNKNSPLTSTSLFLYADVLLSSSDSAYDSYLDKVAESYYSCFKRACPYVGKLKVTSESARSLGAEMIHADIFSTNHSSDESISETPNFGRRNSNSTRSDIFSESQATIDFGFLSTFNWNIRPEMSHQIIWLVLNEPDVSSILKTELALELLRRLTNHADIQPWLRSAKIRNCSVYLKTKRVSRAEMTNHSFFSLTNAISQSLTHKDAISKSSLVTDLDQTLSSGSRFTASYDLSRHTSPESSFNSTVSRGSPVF